MIAELVLVDHGGRLCHVEISEELIKEAIDPETMRLKVNSEFSVVPVGNVYDQGINELHLAYQHFCEFRANMSARIAQSDAVLEAVGYLFKPRKIFHVKTQQDIKSILKTSGMTEDVEVLEVTPFMVMAKDLNVTLEHATPEGEQEKVEQLKGATAI